MLFLDNKRNGSNAAIPLTLTFVLLTFVASCYKEVEVTLPKYQSKPVVSCLFTNSEPLSINLSESKDIFSPDSTLYIDDALVIVFENGSVFDTLEFKGNGNYITNRLPTSGNSYELLVQLSDGGIVTAADYLPYPVGSPCVSFKDSIRYTDFGLFISQAIICFEDNGAGSNLYEVKLEAFLHPIFRLYGPDIIGVSSPILFMQNSDPVLSNEGTEDYSRSILFSNELFMGNPVCITADYYRFNIYSSDGSDNYDLVVKFRTITESYYRYKKHLDKHIQTQPQVTDFWEMLGDPVPMVSNIEGGYGIFAGYTQTIDTVSKVILIPNE